MILTINACQSIEGEVVGKWEITSSTHFPVRITSDCLMLDSGSTVDFREDRQMKIRGRGMRLPCNNHQQSFRFTGEKLSVFEVDFWRDYEVTYYDEDSMVLLKKKVAPTHIFDDLGGGKKTIALYNKIVKEGWSISLVRR